MEGLTAVGNFVDELPIGVAREAMLIGGRVSLLFGGTTEDDIARTTYEFDRFFMLSEPAQEVGAMVLQSWMERGLGGGPSPPPPPGTRSLHAKGFGTPPPFDRATQYGDVPKSVKRLVLETFVVCAYCADAPATRVDHILSVKLHWELKGWKMTYEQRTADVNRLKNLAGSCELCNLLKSSKRLGEGPKRYTPPVWIQKYRLKR